MSETISQIGLPPQFPDHTQLPESDGTFVKNFEEHPQSVLLTDSIELHLRRLHPDGQYCIGQDSGIYWRETEPPERGAEAPDWFFVAGVPPKLDGIVRRSYVVWREFIAPTIALEFASGDGSEERDWASAQPSDRTPLSRSNGTTRPGKFWVYERIINIPFYSIYEINSGRLEVYHLVEGSYQIMTPNERGHYPIGPMQVELGLWQGTYLNFPEQLWLRWWDEAGNLLLTGAERAQQAEQRAQQAEQQAEQERQQREQLMEKLRSLSLDQLRALGISTTDL